MLIDLRPTDDDGPDIVMFLLTGCLGVEGATYQHYPPENMVPTGLYPSLHMAVNVGNSGLPESLTLLDLVSG
jgi:hypothetical protein